MSYRVPPSRLLLFFVVALAGCATASPFRPSSDSAHADARLTVRNPQWNDLTVYLVRDGGQMRLGVVPGNASRTLTIPDSYIPANCLLRLVAMSSGRETQGASDYFELEPGSQATWSVGITGTVTPVGVVPPAY